jgi:hypothetical protein
MMIAGLEKVTSRRTWFVPNVVIWGLPVWQEIEFLAVEEVTTDKSVFYGSLDIGDTAQQVSFSDLTDHRGNQLPATISSPSVLVRTRSQWAAFVIGEESDASFKIARDPEASDPVAVDLMVIEMGD